MTGVLIKGGHLDTETAHQVKVNTESRMWCFFKPQNVKGCQQVTSRQGRDIDHGCCCYHGEGRDCQWEQLLQIKCWKQRGRRENDLIFILSVLLEPPTFRDNRKPAAKESWGKQSAYPQVQNCRAEWRRKQVWAEWWQVNSQHRAKLRNVSKECGLLQRLEEHGISGIIWAKSLESFLVQLVPPNPPSYYKVSFWGWLTESRV